MLVITVARKPLIGSVAANVIKHGTGGLNIDACRIGTGGDRTPGGRSGSDSSSVLEDGFHAERRDRPTGGRFPANLILEHLSECVCQGPRKVQDNRVDTRPEGDGGRADKNQWRFRPTDATRRGYSGGDGKETVEAWECAPGCPVAELDAGSLAGGMHSAGKSRGGGLGSQEANRSSFGTGHHPGNGARLGDSGGASRFFKQVGGKS